MSIIEERFLNKKGNVSLYVVVGAIMIGVLVFLGVAFSGNIKGSLYKSFSTQNAGFDYYKNNIATQDIP